MMLTNDQQYALQTFLSGENILLLGDPGTGKSTLISTIVAHAEAKGLRVAKTASTGIASQLIGGRTIHSFLKAFPGMSHKEIDYSVKIENLNHIDVLIIDEVSMLGKTFISYLYNCLKHANHHIQLIIVGDFFQLPPVKDGYAFTSPLWNQLGLTPCFLREIVRQNDTEFIDNIKMLKDGDRRCLDYLLSHSSPHPLSGQLSICATRNDAYQINRIELEKINEAACIYVADYEGIISESDLRVEKYLVLKKGMRVMSLINGITYSNGSLGTITNLDSFSVEVMFDSGISAHFEKTCFTVDRKDILGETTDLWQIVVRQIKRCFVRQIISC